MSSLEAVRPAAMTSRSSPVPSWPSAPGTRTGTGAPGPTGGVVRTRFNLPFGRWKVAVRSRTASGASSGAAFVACGNEITAEMPPGPVGGSPSSLSSGSSRNTGVTSTTPVCGRGGRDATGPMSTGRNTSGIGSGGPPANGTRVGMSSSMRSEPKPMLTVKFITWKLRSSMTMPRAAISSGVSGREVTAVTRMSCTTTSTALGSARNSSRSPSMRRMRSTR